jgi:hypothetical protein
MQVEKVEIDETIEKEQYVNVALSIILPNCQDKGIYQEVRNFYALIMEFKDKGKLVLPAQEDMKRHLTSFSFVVFEGVEKVEGIDYMSFTLDRNAFKTSNELRVHTKEFVRDMNKHAEKLEIKAKEARSFGRNMELAFLGGQLLM